MVDVVSKLTRSRMMAGIRATDTRPERLVRSALWRQGYRFQLHGKGLPGRPDIVLPKWKTVVQVQGCFWHGHTHCRYFRYPGTRKDFWRRKIIQNRARDSKVANELEQLGFRWIVVWECALRDDPGRTIRLLTQGIAGKGHHLEIRSVRRVAFLISHRCSR